jgi:hypothetical protein
MNTTTEIFDSLAALAVSDTELQRKRNPKRRPTWAPPLPFDSELSEKLDELKALRPVEDYSTAYGRLWAKWTNAKWAGGKLSGFELRAGKLHNGERITELNPQRDGSWKVGPYWSAPGTGVCPVKPLGSDEELEKEFDRGCRPRELKYFEESPERRGYWLADYIIKEKKRFIEDQERFVKEQAMLEKWKIRFPIQESLRELGLACILNFCDSPDTVMQLGGQISGMCCCCGKLLTDPTSVKLGIGPECRGFHS